MPQAPKGLLGLANLRGTVLPVASLRGLLGLSEAAETEPGTASRAIVIDAAAPVALVVDAIGALVSVEPDQVEMRQAELAAKPGEKLKGAFATTTAAGAMGGVAKILDIGALIAGAFVQQERARPRQSLAVSAGSGDDRRGGRRLPAAGELRCRRPGICLSARVRCSKCSTRPRRWLRCRRARNSCSA